MNVSFGEAVFRRLNKSRRTPRRGWRSSSQNTSNRPFTAKTTSAARVTYNVTKPVEPAFYHEKELRLCRGRSPDLPARYNKTKTILTFGDVFPFEKRYTSPLCSSYRETPCRADKAGALSLRTTTLQLPLAAAVRAFC